MSNQKRPRIKGSSRRGFRPSLEACEKRQLLSIQVTTEFDTNEPGSLRFAIGEVNAGNVADNTVEFNIFNSIGTASTIFLGSELPTITHEIHIDGLTQPQSTPNTQLLTDDAVLQVTLDGRNAQVPIRGLVFGTGSNGSSVDGLVFRRFGDNVIEIQSNNVHVYGNFIGVDRSGSIQSPTANSLSGVVILGGSGNTIGGSTLAERNLISGNGGQGVWISDGDGNVVTSNFIGPDATGGFVPVSDGSLTPGNGQNGILISGGLYNSIGGATLAERNIISGNRANGVEVTAQATGVKILNNVIGLQSDGTATLANLLHGVAIEGNTQGLIIGGIGALEGNVISGNGLNGIEIQTSSGMTAATILGNTVGLGSNGLIVLPNGSHGIEDQGQNDTIGAGNLVSGNTGEGVILGGTRNSILGSTIGLNANGVAAPNGSNGVLVNGSSATIGGQSATEFNVISANLQNGVRVVGPGTSILGNLIGLSRDGLTARPNRFDGVIIDLATDTLIRGAYLGGNTNHGIHVVNAASETRIEGSVVGLGLDGSTPVGNGLNGILVQDSSSTTIGGTSPTSRNVVSSNGANGILIVGLEFSPTWALIASNYVGLDVQGLRSRGNSVNGIALVNADRGTTIGGANIGNWISGNGSSGIYGESSRDIPDPNNDLLISGNVLGLSPAQSAAMPNLSSGILLNRIAAVTIGGTSAPLRNVIANNGGDGITIQQRVTSGGLDSTTIQGNYIGLGVDGLSNQGNTADGIKILGGTSLRIGGPGGARNWVANNRANGLNLIDSNPGSGWIVLNNVVGLNTVGAGAGNHSDGITLNRVSNSSISSGNVISGNFANGISLRDTSESSFLSMTGNSISGNLIGLGLDGVTNRGNGINGIDITNGVASTIGGDGAYGNQIGFNGAAGVLLRSRSSGTILTGNKIGVDASGTGEQGNGSQGILILDSPGNRVGGLFPSNENLISGNRQSGVQIQGSQANGNWVVGNKIGLTGNGQAILNNGIAGVWILDASGNTVGAGGTNGTVARNLFSGNGEAGVLISGSSSTGNQVLGNWFGLAADGSSLPAVGAVGVFIDNAQGNVIGAPDAVNVISNQSGASLQSIGIYVAGGSGNRIQSNLIGTDATGTSDRGNNSGIVLVGAPGNTIGGATAALGNVISGNDDINLSINGSGASSNLISLNIVGLAANGQSRLTNQHINDPNLIPTDPNRFTDPRSRVGLQTQDAPGTRIENNTVSDNRIGIGVFGAGSTGTTLFLNRVGTDSTGKILGPGQGINSSGNGVGVFINDAPSTTIGKPGQGNLILGNQSVGIEFFGAHAQRNVVQANTIGASDNGIFFNSGVNNVIGGLTAPEGNSIVGNRQAGVFIFSPASSGNFVGSNRITDNGTYGVLLLNTRADNPIIQSGSAANTFLRNRLGRVSVVVGPVPGGAVAGLATGKKATRRKA